MSYTILKIDSSPLCAFGRAAQPPASELAEELMIMETRHDRDGGGRHACAQWCLLSGISLRFLPTGELQLLIIGTWNRLPIQKRKPKRVREAA